MSKLLFNFSRLKGSNFLRATLREDNRPRPHLPPPQFLFWFNEQPGLFTPSPALIRGQQNALLNVIEARSDRNQDRQYEEFDYRPGLLQALHYSVVLAVGYSLTHDRDLFNTLLTAYCPVVRFKEVKNIQAQPFEDGDNKNSQFSLLREDENIKLKQKLSNDFTNITNELNNDIAASHFSQTESSIFSSKSENPFFFNREHKTKDSQYISNIEKHINSDEVVSTSDYSSNPSEEADEKPEFNKLNEAEIELMRLQDSIPIEVDTLIALQETREGKEGSVEKLKSLAYGQNGCSSALFYLAMAYQQGRQVEKDLEKAAQLYSSASNQGHSEAKYNLGVLLIEEGNFKRGRQLIEEAANSGVREAREAMGIRNQTEDTGWKGSRRDVEELVDLAIELEELGDLMMAKELYKVAVSQGHKKAAVRLERMLKNKNKSTRL